MSCVIAIDAGTTGVRAFAVGDDGKPRRAVISTHTISLQEQLLLKDLPLLNSVIPREFATKLVKGRGNYLSLRRLNNAVERAVSLFSTEDEFSQLRQVQQWAKKTNDGSLSDLRYGSTTSHVVRRAACPVLTVRQPADDRVHARDKVLASDLPGHGH